MPVLALNLRSMQKPSSSPRWSFLALALVGVSPLAPPAFAADVITDPIYEYQDEVEKGEFSYDDSQDIPWIENETEVLGLPEPENLVAVELAQLPSGMQLSVDASRITVNPDDQVVRTWVWIRSSSGAENGTFEGFRCDTREHKTYAYGAHYRKPQVTKAKRPRWREAPKTNVPNYRRELMDLYLCGYGEPRDADVIRRYLSGDMQGELIFSDW